MLAVLAVIGYFLVRFQVLIMPLIMAFVLAYLLDPVVSFLTRRLRLSRTAAVLVLYGLVLLLLAGLASGAGLLLQQQMSGVLNTVTKFINSIPDWLDSLADEPLVLGPFTFDFSSPNAALLQDTLISGARDWIGGITDWMTTAASDIVAFFGWTAFTLIVTYYLLHDMDALKHSLILIFPEKHRGDIGRLFEELGPIWNAFLRGQILLSLIMGLAIGAAMTLLGVRYSAILGVMAAVAEFIPIVGANVVGATAVVIALFQPNNWLGLSPILFAVVVGVTGGVLQQLESNFLIPRVMGDQLKLHPAILIVGALVGFTLLGIPGLLLAGPIIASARLFAKYVHAKLFDLPPWPVEGGAQTPDLKTAAVRIRPARMSDRKDMLELTAQIWEGHDYTPQVWSEWLADREGLLAAAEADRRMIGFGKLTRLGPEEWWLEGLRVHPGYQGMKIGSRLSEHLLAEWKKHGGVIRLATSSQRLPVHRLCDRLGFRRAGVFRMTSAAPIEGGACEYEAAAKTDTPEATALWKERAAAWKIPNLVNDGWHWSTLTKAHLAEFVRRGDAWWWRGRSALLLTYDSEHDHKPSLEVAAVFSPPGSLAPMLRQLRVLAGKRGAVRAAWNVPDRPRLTDAARRAGFAEMVDHRLWLYERSDPPVL